MEAEPKPLSRPRKALVLAVCASIAVSGCANMQYQVASDDPCGPARQQLKSIEDYFLQSAAAGAIGGALVGALAGGLIGGDAKGAAIGAAAGAAAGGLGGYFLAKQQANQGDPTKTAQAISGDITTENAQLDRVSTAFRGARDCRFNAAERVKADFRAGRIDRAAAQARLARQRTLFNEDVEFARGLGSKFEERGNEFRFASDQLVGPTPAVAQAAPTPAPAPAATPQRAPARPAPAPARPATASKPPEIQNVAQLTESNQVKRKALSDDIAGAQTAAARTFELEGSLSRLPPEGAVAQNG
jgi:hypothetical protein